MPQPWAERTAPQLTPGDLICLASAQRASKEQKPPLKQPKAPLIPPQRGTASGFPLHFNAFSFSIFSSCFLVGRSSWSALLPALRCSRALALSPHPGSKPCPLALPLERCQNEQCLPRPLGSPPACTRCTRTLLNL